MSKAIQARCAPDAGLTTVVGAVAFLLCSCPGNVPRTAGDLQSASPDPAVAALDAGPVDSAQSGPPVDGAPAVKDVAATARDFRFRRDWRFARPDANPLGGCKDWTRWNCSPDPVLLCNATCMDNGTLHQVRCTKLGTCVCGIAPGPCGKFTFAAPCDACRQAVEGGCCNL